MAKDNFVYNTCIFDLLQNCKTDFW